MSSAPSVRKVTCWLACMPWAASSSKRPRLGLVSWVWTNPKHLAGPSAGTLLPAMTSNQPSWRERCRAECTVAAVQADRQRQVRAGQLLPVGRAALDEERAFGAQVVVEALADPVGVAAHRGRVQRPAQRQQLAEQPGRQPGGDQPAELGLQVDQFRGAAVR